MRFGLLLLGMAVVPCEVGAQSTTRPVAVTARYEISSVDAIAAIAGVQLLSRIADTATAVKRRLPDGDPALAAVDRIQRSAQYLTARWDTKKLIDAGADPIALRRSLAYDVAALEAAAQDTNLANVRSMLAAIDDDITDKAEHCQKSPSGMVTNVRVRVRTWNGTAESPNWRVFYMPKIMEAAKDPSVATLSFSAFSSPTTAALPPGRYVMWASMPGDSAKVGERITVRVGRGLTTMDQDLAVPK